MSVQLRLPQTSVTVTAGRSALVELHVTNRGTSARRVRLTLTGRAGAWVQLAMQDGSSPEGDDGEGLVLPGESRTTLSLLVSPPPTVSRSEQIVPFTVRAVDTASGEVASPATGLLVVSAPEPVSADLTPSSVTSRRGSQHVLHLTTDDPAGLLITLRAVAADRRTRVTVDPVAVRVEPGRPARADVRVEVRPTLVRRRHDVELVWETDGPDGLARGATKGRLDQVPVLPPFGLMALATVLVAALVMGAWAVWPNGTGGDGRPAGTATVEDEEPSPAPSPVAAVPTRPFVVLDVRLKGPDPAASRTAAEDLARAAPVVDGQSARIVDGADVRLDPEFWLVVVEGFRAVQDARAYCRQQQPRECSVVE